MSCIRGVSKISAACSVRSSSYDRSGGNDDWVAIPAGGRKTIAEFDGPGRIVHIWTTHWSPNDPLSKRNLVLRCTWDGCEAPSVLSPIGDFFGQGWGLDYPFSSLPLAAAPRGGKSLVCYFPMPFRERAVIEIENESKHDLDRYYYYVDAELGSVEPEEGYFHASYRQELTSLDSPDGLENAWVENSTDPKNQSDLANYLWLEAQGQGHFAGVNYYVNAPSVPWPGEGDDMFLVDGEAWPGLHGTGTEDYFNTAWGPDDVFSHPYFGIAHAPGRNNDDPRYGWAGRMHYYRFHLEDPIRFQRSLRASIEHGHANGMALDLASVAYWYQTRPAAAPDLPRAELRAPRPLTTVEEVHRWRAAWLRSNEPWGPNP
ncbi:MAG: glycoside hydrolase family 172 protein [Fimbriimonadaceae bacterium]